MDIYLKRFLQRHLIIFLTVTAFSIATPQFDARAEAEDNGGFYFILEGRHAFSDGDKTPWADRLLTTGPELIDTDIGGGGRIAVGFQKGKWDFGLFYTGLHITGDRVRIHGDPDNLYPVLGYGGYTSGYDDATTEAQFTYHVVDFEAGYNINMGSTDVRLFAGVRYADLDQQVNSTFYTFPSASPYLGLEKRDVNFKGAGLRLGANVSKTLFGPFGVTGGISGAFLAGDQVTLTMQDQTLGTTTYMGDHLTKRFDFRVAGSADGELGLTYRKQIGSASTLIFTAGYRAEAWFNVNNTQSEPPTYSGNVHGTMHANQFFHGAFFRGEWRFD
ncbi:MAG: Lpg1974 family pore-forming outer membrane protein [Nitrospinales bacterium]